MGDCLMGTLDRETALLLLRSLRTEVLKSVELYLDTSLEMAGHLVGILGERLHSHC